MVIDYSNLYKLRINNIEESSLKHDIIKLAILRKLLKKYSNIKNYIYIYTELPLTNKEKVKKTDLLFLNVKTKEAYSYEIQNIIDSKWMSETKEFYKDWDYPFMRTSDLIIIPIKDLSDNILELSEQLNQYII